MSPPDFEMSQIRKKNFLREKKQIVRRNEGEREPIDKKGNIDRAKKSRMWQREKEEVQGKEVKRERIGDRAREKAKA